MSKTNKIKQKTTGFDIVYRVVAAIMAVAMYPVFYFGKLLTFEIVHEDISNLLNYFKDEADKTIEATYDSISLADLSKWTKLFSSFTNDDFDFKTAILQNEMYTPVIIAAVFVAIALVIGLVILGFAIFSNKVKVITALSGAGFLSTFAAYISFGFFAKPLISGEITLAQLFNVDGIIGSTIMSFLGDVTVFALDTAFFGVMFLMLGILVWSVSVLIVNKSEEKEKQMKEAARKYR
ncbi:MAG: hypothetical protein J6Q50_00855 [Clostridia bacterium]|nr:hypothetical protein [Clostridia bacterium]